MILKSEQGVYSLENNPKQVQKPRNEISESVSEASKSPLPPLLESQPEVFYTLTERSEEYNLPSNQDKGLNRVNFITFKDNFVGEVWQSPGNISEDEKIEIIKKGFQLNQEGKISLKKYYESTQEYSLFQSKGYSVKSESIRKTTLYQKLKP